MRPSQHHAGFFAFLAHRLSGIALAVFLPFHFLVLGLALEASDPLDRFLAFAEYPLVKAMEWILVMLLTLHLALGLRVLAIELLAWAGLRSAWIGWGTAAAFATGALFLVSAF